MNNLKAYQLSISSVVLRFYLMMFIVLTAGFSGYWLVGLLALPVLISIMVGVKIAPTKRIGETSKAKNISLPKHTVENYSKVA